VAATAQQPSASIGDREAVPRRTLIVIAATGFALAAINLYMVQRNFFEIPNPDHGSHPSRHPRRITNPNAEDRQIQAKWTMDHTEPARLISIVASRLIAAILVVAFVVANLGLGSEGVSGSGRLQPPATIAR
jgi:hypothetical protein